MRTPSQPLGYEAFHRFDQPCERRRNSLDTKDFAAQALQAGDRQIVQSFSFQQTDVEGVRRRRVFRAFLQTRDDVHVLRLRHQTVQRLARIRTRPRNFRADVRILVVQADRIHRFADRLQQQVLSLPIQIRVVAEMQLRPAFHHLFAFFAAAFPRETRQQGLMVQMGRVVHGV